VRALAAPFTVNTKPEGTLLALAGHTELGHIMATDGGECEKVLAESGRAGVDVDAKSFVASWNDLMAVIGSKSAALK
jgi:transaldolase